LAYQKSPCLTGTEKLQLSSANSNSTQTISKLFSLPYCPTLLSDVEFIALCLHFPSHNRTHSYTAWLRAIFRKLNHLLTSLFSREIFFPGPNITLNINNNNHYNGRGNGRAAVGDSAITDYIGWL
jgi:hypothetical protein